jgi:hypothetical protein
MRIISFDVATKSLAIAIIDYELTENIYPAIEKKFNDYILKKNALLMDDNDNDNVIIQLITEYNELLKYANDALKRRIDVAHLDVTDLIPNKKLKETTIIERTFYLYKYLEPLRPLIKIDSDDLHFLIEYQMGPNDKSRVISSQILLFCQSFFINRPVEYINKRIKMVGPSLKNTISFKNDAMSSHGFYLAKYTTNYAANKNHTKYILSRVLDIYDQAHLLKNIRKKNIDDIADAVCMSIAYTFKSIYI